MQMQNERGRMLAIFFQYIRRSPDCTDDQVSKVSEEGIQSTSALHTIRFRCPLYNFATSMNTLEYSIFPHFRLSRQGIASFLGIPSAIAEA